MAKKTIDDIQVAGKRGSGTLRFQRAHGRWQSDHRARSASAAALPTIQVADRRTAAKVILCSHLGTSEGTSPEA